MDNKEKKYLYDILESIEGVESHIEGRKQYEEFAKSRMMKMAIERKLTIIGEATRKLLRLNPAIKIENATKIIATRNILAHDYDSVDDITIWTIVIKHLPKLKVEVKSLLEK